MNVVVAHHRWGYGGGVTVFYYTIKALVDAGYNVTVSTVDRPDFRSYEDTVGEPFPRSVKVKNALPIDIKMFTVYKGLFSWREITRGSYDAAVSTHGYPMLWGEARMPLVYYMHFPIVLMNDVSWNPGFSRYTLKSPIKHGLKESLTSLLLWLYIKPYVLLSKRLYRKLLEAPDKFLVNSSFTLEALKHTLKMYACCDDVLERTEILYPPVPRVEQMLSARGAGREPCVLTIGRFSSEKNYELAVEVARILKDVRFYIIGGVYGGASRSYYERIRKLAPQNMSVEANVTNERKMELLSKCTVYLHTMAGEHFGIAPVEAMAAGATPIVSTFGGAWTDVCMSDEYCYGFSENRPEEVARAVAEALEKPRVAPPEHVRRFSPEAFAKGIVRAVEEVTKLS